MPKEAHPAADTEAVDSAEAAREVAAEADAEIEESREEATTIKETKP